MVDLSAVIVRPIEPTEEARWDDLMSRHHYLGFERLVGEYTQVRIACQWSVVGALGMGHIGVSVRSPGPVDRVGEDAAVEAATVRRQQPAVSYPAWRQGQESGFPGSCAQHLAAIIRLGVEFWA